MTERSITAGDVARLIRRRLLPILLIAAAAAVAASLFSLAANRSREQYSLTFVVEFGRDIPFRHETVVFADGLEAAKASDAAFSGIDTDRMAAEKDISISAEGEVYPSYTVLAARKYFSGKEQATKFLRAVVSYAVRHAELAAERQGWLPLPMPYLRGRAYAHVREDAREAQTEGGTLIRYRQNTVSVTGGGANPAFAAVFGFLLSFCAASVLFCLTDRRTLLSEQPTEETPAP